jgi:multiple sugar transport system ATP-binding protein
VASIRFEKVFKSFNNVGVIKSLDLTVEDGEFFTFVGPSGCGKSTILNMIAGLEPITGGTIYFGDAPVNELTPRERDVAMVFQSYALYPHMSVAENLAFPLKMKKQPKDFIEAEVGRVAALLGLEALLERRPKELSGGQRQRVALGRAVIRKPKVFLMDEPLSNLDARLRVEMRAELKRLHRQLKITTVYVTHDQAEAMGLSERIAVLREGEIQQCAAPHEVYARPGNIFVAGFIGSPSMNFIDAQVRGEDPLKLEINGVEFSPVVERSPEGEHVTAGIRPEDIIASKKETTPVEAIVDLTEVEGPVTWVNLRWGDAALRVKAAPEEHLKPGDKVFLKFSGEKIHVFHREAGLRL